MDANWMKVLHDRIAESAVGPSALRNQGASGVIAAARKFLKEVDLSDFSVTSQSSYLKVLNAYTESMLTHLPQNTRHWGAARKALNLFLRDVLYNRYLSERFEFCRIEGWMEVPLDKFTAEGIRKDYTTGPLPAWPGLKRLKSSVSEAYQKAAFDLAISENMARVHLDVFYWRDLGHAAVSPDRP